jgi:two-component system, NarL family, response regulator DevR
MTRVFVLDDHDVVRRGLRELLEDSGDIEVVGEAGTVVEARSGIPVAEPDVAVLDVRLSDGSGVEVCREIRSRHPEIKCVMLSAFDDEVTIVESILAGASGYVLKQIKGGDIVNAVRIVANGESLFEPTLRGRVLDIGPEDEHGAVAT